MICKKCGTRFSDGIFCPECGARIMPFSGSGKGQMNTWEAAFEYSDGERYNTKMYGPQGQLEEMRVGEDEIIVDAGGKKVFENKIIIFENAKSWSHCIQVGRNAKLEFMNCTIINYDDNEGPIDANSNVSMTFNHCFIKGKGNLVHEDEGVILEFRDCAFDGGQTYEFNGGYFPIAEAVKLYFENCFFKESPLGRGSKLECRNCVILCESKLTFGYNDDCLIDAENIKMENCFIRSKTKLIYSNSGEIIIRNSYFDDYSCIEIN